MFFTGSQSCSFIKKKSLSGFYRLWLKIPRYAGDAEKVLYHCLGTRSRSEIIDQEMRLIPKFPNTKAKLIRLMILVSVHARAHLYYVVSLHDPLTVLP